jgi:hypothetical protein
VPAYDGVVLTQRHIKGLLGYTMAIWPEEQIRREVLRAMLPRGERKTRPGRVGIPTPQGRTKNVMTGYFTFWLKHFHDWGLIERHPEHVVILAPRAYLYQRAEQWLARDWALHEGVHQAIRVMVDHPPSELRLAEARYQELVSLRKLMEAYPAGGPHKDKGYVRIWPRPGTM